MMDEVTMNIFNRDTLDKIHFFIEAHFWNKVDYDRLKKWLNNFDSITEKYCAFKLLDNFVYYSEKDILRLLKYGLNELIFKRKVLEQELINDFNYENGKILEMRKDFFKKVIVIPLTSMGNATESSFAMTRYLTSNLGYFHENQVFQLTELTDKILNDASHIIIIDDFMGTSNQINEFWNRSKVNFGDKEFYLKDIKSHYKLDIEYFCLVCTDEGLLNFHSENYDRALRITPCEKLTSKFKVFGSDSIYFSSDEMEECQEILRKVCKNNSIELFGYEGLDYAVAFHHAIPDSSLPLFWKESDTWNHLYRNKQTGGTYDYI